MLLLGVSQNLVSPLQPAFLTVFQISGFVRLLFFFLLYGGIGEANVRASGRGVEEHFALEKWPVYRIDRELHAL